MVVVVVAVVFVVFVVVVFVVVLVVVVVIQHPQKPSFELNRRTDEHYLLWRCVVALNKPGRVIRCVSQVMSTKPQAQIAVFDAFTLLLTDGHTYGQTLL